MQQPLANSCHTLLPHKPCFEQNDNYIYTTPLLIITSKAHVKCDMCATCAHLAGCTPQHLLACWRLLAGCKALYRWYI